MVEAVECGHCGQGLPKQLAAKTGVITCPRCGGSITRPPASGNAVAAAKKPSRTAKALEEAMRSMEQKESSRKSKDGGRPIHQEHGAYELNAKRQSAALAPATAPAATAARPAGPSDRLRLKSSQWKLAAGCAAVLIIGMGAYAALAPNSRQSAQRDRVLQLKQEADQLAAGGKEVDAFKKYGQIVLLSASEPVHGADARRAVEDARQARLRLQPLVREAEEKAKLAKYTR